ncbi:MAG: glucose-1-phosphate thymidylyltransferase [Bacteroidetes bacterium GWC2_33_15]|nr:MAG: glucose-1-phosphate thymidylyltransferase [Bacteroidetes bacterium GWA2_33_15]OFX51362.1 MAG: glucose-1-phosphate thymidylyltransferase [Bacteroidetes bacterium GWC2_33_15]OFX63146.1 MAG: glucose-1-phosphate thymidylyltransferase [Bacteroidetes bacterium GWB2_32_14]OFX70738.1 MAG: glucose-1-phosphate thymidylyltransferase [Bacteroidetes bacterium GWD2_33_33]HAN18463.1 glucose-1-phosphate thymidylyltransferase [Bacteroidales bacterium]
MNYILFDDKSWTNLLPLTFTRPVCEIRTGILTIKEKWETYLGVSVSHITQDYLEQKYPVKIESENILINGSVIPDKNLTTSIKNLKNNTAITKDNRLIAVNLGKDAISKFRYDQFSKYTFSEYPAGIIKINQPWEIFTLNGRNIESDFTLLTSGRKSQEISSTNNTLGKENIFIEEGVKMEFATLNAATGPIYIGKDAEIMEGSIIRGPFALCEHSTLKLGAKIYGPTTIGPHSKVGGEVNNSVIFGFSNKAHDGFLGNSVIGEWCNIGADTNNSNLKNNYAEVRLWNYESERFIDTGLQFCGLIMGDHSKCAINTMFNTGTVVGVNANIFGEGFPRNFIPSFSWGGAHGFSVYSIEKALDVAEKVFNRRGLTLTDIEKEILNTIFKKTAKYRKL